MLSTKYKKSLVETVLENLTRITRKPTGRHADFEVQSAIERAEFRNKDIMALLSRLKKIKHKHNLQCENAARSHDSYKVDYTDVDVTLDYYELRQIISSLDLNNTLATYTIRGMEELQQDKVRADKAKTDLLLTALSNSQK